MITAVFAVCFASGFAFASPPAHTSTTESLSFDTSRGGGVFGPSVAVDPCMPYYQQHEWPSTFAAIRKAGFTCVKIIDIGTVKTDTTAVVQLASQCRSAGLAAVLLVFPTTHIGLFQKHPHWKQIMLGSTEGRHDWRTYLCPNQAEFAATYAAEIESKVRDARLDGIQLAEPWLEQWGGPRDGDQVRKHYACVCDTCVRLFQQQTSINPRDMLTSPTPPAWFLAPTNRDLYAKWIDFRVRSISGLCTTLVTAARRGSPAVKIDLMILSDARVEAGMAREYQAQDLPALVAATRPDIVTVQDAWQDWLIPDLRPSFIADYGVYYTSRIEKACPGCWRVSHADIGSKPASKRSRQWIQEFAHESTRAGFHASAYYERSISAFVKEAGN